MDSSLAWVWWFGQDTMVTVRPLVWQQLQIATDGIRWMTRITRMVMIQLADRSDMGSNSAEISDMTLGPDKPKMSESLCCMVSRHKGEGEWKGQPKAHHHYVEWVHEMPDDCCSTTHMPIAIVVESITVMFTSWLVTAMVSKLTTLSHRGHADFLLGNWRAKH